MNKIFKIWKFMIMVAFETKKPRHWYYYNKKDESKNIVHFAIETILDQEFTAKRFTLGPLMIIIGKI